MTRRRTMASLLMIGALGLGGGLVAGCGDDDSGGDVGDLKVGVLVPLTGDLAQFGGPGSDAANLAAAQINAAAGDTGINLTLITEDTKTDPQGAQEAATKLIESDGVSAVAGPWGSPEVIPTAENVTVAAGVPMVTPSATGAELTELDDDGLVFRTAPSDALQGKVLASVVADALGADATVVTANRNDTYGVSLVEQFTTAFEEAGGTVARNVAYNPEAASLNSEASQIAEGNPDGWVIIDYPETWSKIGPALVRTGSWDPAKTFTADGLRSSSLPESAGRPTTEGMKGTTPTALGAPAEPAFDALWKEELDKPRQTYDAQKFDAVILIALAAAAAGSSDPADIAEKITEVSAAPGTKYTFEQLDEALAAAADGEDIDYEGASGPIDLDENGDPVAANYATWAYTDGKLVDDTENIIPVTPEDE